MKRTILLILLGVAAGAAIMWLALHGKAPAPAGEGEKADGEPSEKTTITHDAHGNVTINMSDEAQGAAGIVVTNPVAAELPAEFKDYGRVLDPATLAAAFGEFTAAQAARDSSQAELKRLTALAAQDNASQRALQNAAASAARDEAQFESARLKWLAAGCSALAARPDLPALMRSLGSFESALVRVDLPAGETLPAPPAGARLLTLTGGQVAAAALGEATVVDPQTQSRGFLFLVQSNAPGLAPGAAVTAYLQLPGALSSGVIVPRAAVVRAEGRGWVYVLNEGGAAFTRREIALDHPAESGWFVTGGIAPGDFVVVTGAQTLLSQESKAALRAD